MIKGLLLKFFSFIWWVLTVWIFLAVMFENNGFVRGISVVIYGFVIYVIGNMCGITYAIMHNED